MREAPLINLASRPFGRERAQLVVLTGIGAALGLALLVLLALIAGQRVETRSLHQAIDSNRVVLQRQQVRLAQLQRVLGQPENADALARGVFLNELIARRAVSWTRVFEDLARVMPYNVRLVSVRLPLVAAAEPGEASHLQLDMVVGSERPEAVLDMLRKLNQSSLFSNASVASQQPPNQTDRFFRFHINVGYAQKL